MCSGTSIRLVFETLDEQVAKACGFGEMLRPGSEDYEPTPSAVAE